MPSVIAVLQSVRTALLISDAYTVQEDLGVIVESVTMLSIIAVLQSVRETLLISYAYNIFVSFF